MKFLIFVCTLFFSLSLIAQPPAGVRGRGGASATGALYGKIIDDQKSPLEYAIVKVSILEQKSDTTIAKLIGGALSAGNGDFKIENLPVGKELTVTFELIGFESQERKITLLPSGGNVEKDMGNIKLTQGSTMKELVIEGEKPDFRIEFDKRIYEVSKNPLNEGGTGEDVMRNIPSLQVDIDGNITMRNASPQIFIDGRPTTLTIDQIPADEIQRVEVITNPSAKYDASGGGGGIINIVLKHNRSTGYNGSIRAGIDKRFKPNGGFDINVQEGKLNFFANANLNIRRRLTTGETSRINLQTDPNTLLSQSQNNINDGYFANGRFGVDWFMDNRNTITFSQEFRRGSFNPTDLTETVTDTIGQNDENPISFYYRNSTTERYFRNWGSSILYKHLYAKEGKELTADINFNTFDSGFEGKYDNVYSTGINTYQKQSGSGGQDLYTAQLDFVDIYNKKIKLEAGLRGSYRTYSSTFDNFSLEDGSFVLIPNLGVNYKYTDQVYAGYFNLSNNGEKWKNQVGLRVESSDYRGELVDTTVTFRNQFPLSFFPSAFITRVINSKQDIQLALNRRVNRPNFRNLVPFTDYSDSLNIERGNPALKPEFTYSGELSYQYVINNKHTFLATVYGRYTTNTTINYIISEYSEILGKDVVINTYANAKSSNASGLEVVFRNKWTEWMEMTTNFNVYNASIDGSNISANLKNSRSTYWLKSNISFRLPENFMISVMGDYSSKKALDPGGTSRGGGGGDFGGGGRYGGTDNTVQGYVEPIYGFDISVRKSFLKSKSLSVSLMMSDVFRTRVSRTHSESEYFIQDIYRRRDPQMWRLNISWKFGKLDQSLFKRKNTNQGSEMMEG